MKEYPKLRLISAKTRAEIIKDIYTEDKFLVQITQRIIEDIDAAFMFEEMGSYDPVTGKELTNHNAMKEVHYGRRQ